MLFRSGYGASESGLDYNRTYISDIELFNVYFPPFAAAFDAGAIKVMPSFSDVNGQPGAGCDVVIRKSTQVR